MDRLFYVMEYVPGKIPTEVPRYTLVEDLRNRLSKENING